jgi:predicted Zn-dependent peptidase
MRTLVFLVLAALVVPTAGAAPPRAKAVPLAAKPAARGARAIPIQEVTLKNGLRVILSEDHSAPTYSICVTYDVGSRDERAGRTGFAHLFEHMMFQGSENVGKGEQFILIQSYGGGMNGTTNADRTNYFETLPANQLELGLFLEADRMRSLAINSANLDNQRNAVQEERRLGIDNQPYGKTFEAILETAYDNFAYKHSTIGSMDDLNAASLPDVADFFRIYYAPNNAVLTLVGDFDAADALARVRRHFESIPAQARPPAPDMTEPTQAGERRKTLDDAFAQTPRIDVVYKIPPGNTSDWFALSVLGQVLASGDSSRLYQALVKDKEVAVNVFGGAQERRGPSLASVIVLTRPGKDFGEIERLVYAEVERLKSEPLADWELNKARLQFRRQRAQQLQSSLARAILLGQYAVYYRDPQLINTIEGKVGAVAKEDVQRVARQYLTDANRTVITTVPKPRAPAAPAASGN